jgi:hypothetical protein
LLYRGHQFIGPIRLEDPSAHTGFQAVPDDLLGFHVGKHQYFLVLTVSQNLAGRVNAVQVRRANIQDEKIWLQLPAFYDGFASIGGLSTDLPSCVRSDQRTQAHPKNWMIISQQNAKRAHRNLLK